MNVFDQTSAAAADFPDAIKPWQRLSASLHATGTPIHDIVTHVNKTVYEVSDFITSSRGQQIIGSILGENQIRLYDLLDAAAVDSLLTLIKIRDGLITKPSERIAACKELLSRTLPGVKARDVVMKEGSAHTDDIHSEIERLQKQIASV